MKPENFLTAIKIAASFHNTRITVNHTTDGGTIGDKINGKPTIIIHRCCAGYIEALREEGFMVAMGDEGMSIADYKVA